MRCNLLGDSRARKRCTTKAERESFHTDQKKTHIFYWQYEGSGTVCNVGGALKSSQYSTNGLSEVQYCSIQNYPLDAVGEVVEKLQRRGIKNK